MAIYLTADTHGTKYIGKLEDFNAEGLTRDDYVIILGDFCFPWESPESPEDERWLDWFESRPWTTLFLDGNHENFAALATYPTADWHGGSVRVLRPHVLQLRRAQVFEIGGRTFFTLGGAHSIDKEFRTPFVSWWPQEVPDEHERAAIDTLVAQVGEVDYVLTHCPPLDAYNDLDFTGPFDKPDEFMRWLQTHVADKLAFKRWFYGHMHADRPWDPRYAGLFDMVYDLDDTGRTGVSPSTDWGDFDSYPDW